MNAERAAQRFLLTAFWVPLALCTYMALAPSPPDPGFEVSDIVLHAFAFSYLTLAVGTAYPSVGAVYVAAWMLGYGAAIEVLQGFGTARHAELKDLLVDAAGILVGLGALRLLGGWSRRTVHAVAAAVLGDRRAGQ